MKLHIEKFYNGYEFKYRVYKIKTVRKFILFGKLTKEKDYLREECYIGHEFPEKSSKVAIFDNVENAKDRIKLLVDGWIDFNGNKTNKVIDVSDWSVK